MPCCSRSGVAAAGRPRPRPAPAPDAAGASAGRTRRRARCRRSDRGCAASRPSRALAARPRSTISDQVAVDLLVVGRGRRRAGHAGARVHSSSRRSRARDRLRGHVRQQLVVLREPQRRSRASASAANLSEASSVASLSKGRSLVGIGMAQTLADGVMAKCALGPVRLRTFDERLSRPGGSGWSAWCSWPLLAVLVLRRARTGRGRPPCWSGCSSMARWGWSLVTAAAIVRCPRASLTAGRARIPCRAPGPGRGPRPGGGRAVRGPESDPAGYHLIRGWVPAGVKMAVDRPERPRRPTGSWRPGQPAGSSRAAIEAAPLRVHGLTSRADRQRREVGAHLLAERRVSRWLTMLPAIAPDIIGPSVTGCGRLGGPAGGARPRLAAAPEGELHRGRVERVDAAAVGPGDQIGHRALPGGPGDTGAVDLVQLGDAASSRSRPPAASRRRSATAW